MELGQYRVNIVMEYCDGGDLRQYIERNIVMALYSYGGDLRQYIERNRPLSEAAVCAILVPIVQALLFFVYAVMVLYSYGRYSYGPI